MPHFSGLVFRFSLLSDIPETTCHAHIHKKNNDAGSRYKHWILTDHFQILTYLFPNKCFPQRLQKNSPTDTL